MLIKGLKKLKTTILPDNWAQVRRGGGEGSAEVQPKAQVSHFFIFEAFPKIFLILARAVAVAVGRRSGGRLATTLVATISTVIFFSFFFSFFFFLFISPSSMFLIEGVLGSKNLFSESGSKWPIT